MRIDISNRSPCDWMQTALPLRSVIVLIFGSVTHSFQGGLSDSVITTLILAPFRIALIAEPVDVLNWIAPEIR